MLWVMFFSPKEATPRYHRPQPASQSPLGVLGCVAYPVESAAAHVGLGFTFRTHSGRATQSPASSGQLSFPRKPCSNFCSHVIGGNYVT